MTHLPKARLILLFALAVSPAAASEPEIGYSHYPPVTNDFERPASEIELTAADKEEILISAYSLLPEQHWNRAVEKIRVQDQVRATQHVEVWFEPEAVSPDRTETFITYCQRKLANPEWRCHAASQQAYQRLPGDNEPTRVSGPIDQSVALEVAATLQAFVAKNLATPPEIFEIHSMIRLGSIGVDGPDEPGPRIQAKAVLDAYEVAMDLSPRTEDFRQLAVTRIACYANLETNDPQCDVSESPMLAKLSDAATENHRELLLSESDLQELLTIIRPLVSHPELLAGFKAPMVREHAGSISVRISFEPYALSENRTIRALARCANEADGPGWQCQVDENVKLTIPGQQKPIAVLDGLTDEEALRLVEHVREQVSNHPELGTESDELRIRFLMASTAQDNGDTRFSGPIFVHATMLGVGELYISFDQLAFEMGELVISEIRTHQQDGAVEDQ